MHALCNLFFGVFRTLPIATDVPMIVSEDPFRLGVQMPAVLQHVYKRPTTTARRATLCTCLRHQRALGSSAVRCGELMQDFEVALTDDALFGPPAAGAEMERVARVSCVHGEMRAFARKAQLRHASEWSLLLSPRSGVVHGTVRIELAVRPNAMIR